MELVYLWVENYKNIHKQGFNFSPQFECKFYDEYDEKGNLKDNCKLEIKPKEHIENFFGKNINITAIVGKNGSGKSSVSEAILPKVPHKKHKKYLLVGYSKYFYKHMFGNKDPNKLGWQEKFHSYGSVKNFRCMDIDKITKNDIRLSASSVEIGAIGNREYRHNLIYINGRKLDFDSFENLSYSDSDDSIFIPKYIIQYKHNLNIFKTKTFFYQFDKVKFYIEPLDRYQIISDINKMNTIDEIIKEIIIEHITWINKENIFCTVFIAFLIRYYLINLSEKEKDINTEEIQDNINKIIEIENCFKIDIQTFSFIKRIDNIVEALNLLKSHELKKENTIISNDEKFYYEFDMNDNFDSLWIFENILDLFALKKENIPIFKLELYDSKKDLFYNLLSNGEKQYLRLLIEIIANKGSGSLSSGIEPSIYIFDEIETSLHPQWQKRIFNDIVNIFKSWRNKKVHLIFLTHSPFLLSDIPKQNIIFLDKDEKGNCKVVDGLKEKKQTFGANIHTLLSDSFFMEDGLMGEFAKSKIDDVINYLHDKESKIKSDDEAQKLIHIIGEPIVKNQLQRMLDSRRLKKIDEIEVLKKSILEMQKRLNELEK